MSGAGWPRGGARRSLRGRLLLGLGLLHLAALLATAACSWLVFGRTVSLVLDEQMRLVAEAQAVAGAARPHALGDDEVLQRGAVVVQWWDPDGRALVASARPALAVPLQATPGFRDLPAAGADTVGWRVYTAPALAQAGAPRVQVLQSQSFRRHRVMWRALAEGLPLLLLLPLALALMAAVVARASHALRAVADEVAAQDGQARAGLRPERVPDEIAPLVAAFNGVLARLRQALQQQRRFVQDAAHELRTPMTAIALQIENLRAHLPAGPAQARFDELQAGVARARHLVEQLLSLSRQEGDAGVAPAEAVDLATLLRDSVGQLMPLADRRRIDLGCECPAGVRLHGPLAELRSVFDNLIDNAVRYTPEGGVVDVRLCRGAPGDAWVDIVDNGPGIAPQWLDRAFDRFFRVPGSAAGGSGLGLSIAQAAARRWGLRIDLRNRRHAEGGPGLRVRVHLPALTPGSFNAHSPLTRAA